jgi:hypothetical protein
MYRREDCATIPFMSSFAEDCKRFLGTSFKFYLRRCERLLSLLFGHGPQWQQPLGVPD